MRVIEEFLKALQIEVLFFFKGEEYPALHG
jgi:hypothetical protein